MRSLYQAVAILSYAVLRMEKYMEFTSRACSFLVWAFESRMWAYLMELLQASNNLVNTFISPVEMEASIGKYE